MTKSPAQRDAEIAETNAVRDEEHGRTSHG